MSSYRLYTPIILHRTVPTGVIAQIQKVVADATQADFSDIGHGALIVIGLHTLPNFGDKLQAEARFRSGFLGRVALIDQQIQHLIGGIVGKAEFVLVSLTFPQVGAGSLVDEVAEAPSFGTQVETDYILGMANMDGQVKILLDIDRVLTDEVIAKVEQAA